ncbi:MAG: hypothetical protein ABI670_04125 [Chloroflexota bacterium]
MKTSGRAIMKGLSAAAMLLLVIPALGGGQSYAQGNNRTFPETGKTVQGQFLTYWEQNGGLAQQGFPISNEIQERSDTDGRTYTVQYFERAVFEMHPELGNKVLLSLLGNFLYKQKYPSGAPSQQPNNAAGSAYYAETGHRVGGKFQAYWQSHGGLAQQGFPISDEFQERSSLDGKTYVVQYFERAVFEYHPENAGTAYEVLLSQLGKFRYDQKYAGSNPPAPPAGGNPPPAPPAPPAGGAATACGNLPKNINAVSDKNQIRAGDSIRFAAGGFTPAEPMSFWFTLPTGDVVGTARPLTQSDLEYADEDVNPNGDGILGPVTFRTTAEFAQVPGVWAITFHGAYSNAEAVAYFCLTR